MIQVFSIYQIAVQYVITSLTNNPQRLARYAGIFRGVTAFGMMFSFIIDGQGGSYLAQLSFQFSCYGVGIILLYIVAILFTTDSNYFQEDEVIVPAHVELEAKAKGMVVVEGTSIQGESASSGDHRSLKSTDNATDTKTRDDKEPAKTTNVGV